MTPQPSTPSGTSEDVAVSSGGADNGTGPTQEAIASTSGSAAAAVRKQQKKRVYLNLNRPSMEQCQFGVTCRVKLQRCDQAQAPPPLVTPVTENNAISDTPAPAIEKSPASANLRTVSKVKEESESRSSDEEVSEIESVSSDEVKVFPVLPSAPPPPTKQRGFTIAKKTQEKGKSQQKPTRIPCTFCRMTLSSKFYLKIHMRKHTGNHRYSCANCKKSFWNCHTFWKHKEQMALRNGFCPPVKTRDNTAAFVRWTEWRPRGEWKCKICGKRYKSAANYAPHMRGHRGEKPYKCGDCARTFIGSSRLYMHRRIHHSGIRQFNCIFCEKGFYQTTSYYSHLRGHTEEKPYFCLVDGCGASYRDRNGLIYHRSSAH